VNVNGRAVLQRAAVAAALAAGVGSAVAGMSATARGLQQDAAANEAAAKIGEAIYLRGVLESGAPLQAVRERGVPGAKGAEAACVNCHLRSGLGSTHENSGAGGSAASNQIPPVAGKYLFQHNATGHEEANLPYVDGMRANRSPYTPATFARSLREGVDSDGHPLRPLMPRFALGDRDTAALIAYLNTLDPTRVPGVSAGVLHFATIITPEIEPERRAAMLDVMQKYFFERNSRQMVHSAPMRASGRTQYGRSMLMVHRQWELHVWDLSGPQDTWEGQLEKDFAREPVLAVVSGLGHHWAPVHAFCEKKRLACLFPNAEVPVDARGDFYELYLSRGVLLEAGLIQSALGGPTATSLPRRVHQVYRAGDSGEAAAQALALGLKSRGIEVREFVLPGAGGDVAAAIRSVPGADALVLWLRPADLGALGDADTAPATVYLSGLMGGLERSPLPAGWRARAHMAYPFDLPSKRIVRVDYPLGWFRIRKIPVVDEPMQADTYLACGLLSEALSHMVDTFYGPYLIEQLQAMVEHRIVTGYYPRLTLAENQHFASKGGYLVHFEGAEGAHIAADGDWIVP
jgi:hypothetical protein